MATPIQNTQTQKELRNAFGLTVTQAPTTAIPVVNVNPKDYKTSTILGNNNSASSGAVTVFTSDAIKQTYVTGIMLGVQKNAACDIATSQVTVNVNVEGANKVIASIPTITLTASSDLVYVPFECPLLIDKNTALSYSATFTVGVLVRTCVVYGYVVDIDQSI